MYVGATLIVRTYFGATYVCMYLRDPALGLVGELARVVVEELVPEAVVRAEEPLAMVTGAVLARLAPLP